MHHHTTHQFNRSKQNFQGNSAFKSTFIQRNIPKTAPQKSRKEATIAPTVEFDISEEDFFGSMLSVDVQPICQPKRISKTPMIGKRKRKTYDHEITPIPKIDTQKLHAPQESKRALTSTSVIRPALNNASTTLSHMVIPNYSQTQKQIKIQIHDSQSSGTIEPLTITQIDTGILQRKPSKSGQMTFSYGSISSNRKFFQKPKSSCMNRSKSPKKQISTNHVTINTNSSTENDKKLKKNIIQETNEKVSTFSEPKPSEKVEEKPTLSVKFDKKAFLKKIDSIDQEIHVKSTIAFTNGRVIPSLHFQKEPDRYVIACAIHTEFTFNFFTFSTNPTIEKNLVIDEESFDLFDSNLENSNRLCRSSKYFKIQKEIFNTAGYKDPLESFMATTPSLTRGDIERQIFSQQLKILSLPSNTLSFETFSEEVQKKYPDNITTESSFPFVSPRLDCSEAPNDVVISDEDDQFDFDMKNCSFGLSNMKHLSALL